MEIAEGIYRKLANHPIGGGVCICWREVARRDKARRIGGCGRVRPAQISFGSQ